jgi:RNA recognition motif-containing protein
MDIYVGNLSYDTKDTDLQSLFEQYGKVSSARVVMDKMTGRSKGFGFVEMGDRAEAEKAIAATNGSDFQGRPLRVNESQPKPRDDRRGGGGGFGGGGGGGFGGGRGGAGGGGGGRGGDRGDRGSKRW